MRLDTSQRDDFESLAYTLLFLLRGNLPWQCYHAHSGMLFGNMKQVREKKRRWTGQRLGEGKVKEFGELLDYARALDFGSKLDYANLKNGFQRLVDDQAEALEFRKHSLITILSLTTDCYCSFRIQSSSPVSFASSAVSTSGRLGS